jgi:nucleotide-binding universal stress UspA family protein
LDGSRLAEGALGHASAVARAFSAEVVLLTVADRSTDDGDDFVDPFTWHARRREAAQYLEAIAVSLRGLGLQVDTAVSEGISADAIVRAALDYEADLVVMTSHGRGGVTEFALAGTVQKVMIAATTSVLIVRARPGMDAPTVRYRRLVAAFDGSHRSEWAVHLAARIAQAHLAELFILHIVPVPETPRRIPVSAKEQQVIVDLVRTSRQVAEDHLEGMRRQLENDKLRVFVRIEEAASIAQAIDSVAMDLAADAVVIGAHGSGCQDDPRWRYGSVAASLIAYGSTPLLVCQDLPRNRSSQKRMRRQRRTPATLPV